MDKLLKLLNTNARLSGEQMAVMLNMTEAEVDAAIAKLETDGVVRGSGIFAGGWGAKRAAVYGVPEEELGRFYAQRTLLKREVLPENVASAVAVLTGADLSHTTGLHIPVDAGVAAAFLR